MNKSDTIKELAGALCKAQAEMPAAPFNSTNPFLKNRYADLGSIIKTAQPILAKHGLSVSQMAIGTGDEIGVTTILMHSSGEYLASTITMKAGEEKGKSDAQVAGSVISYLRRYSLASILGMYADEDNDGNQPSKPAQPQAKATPPANPLKAAAEAATKANGDAPTEKALAEWASLLSQAEAKGLTVPPLPENVTTAQLRAIYAEVRDQVKAGKDRPAA